MTKPKAKKHPKTGLVLDPEPIAINTKVISDDGATRVEHVFDSKGKQIGTNHVQLGEPQ